MSVGQKIDRIWLNLFLRRDFSPVPEGEVSRKFGVCLEVPALEGDWRERKERMEINECRIRKRAGTVVEIRKRLKIRKWV